MSLFQLAARGEWNWEVGLSQMQHSGICRCYLKAELRPTKGTACAWRLPLAQQPILKQWPALARANCRPHLPIAVAVGRRFDSFGAWIDASESMLLNPTDCNPTRAAVVHCAALRCAALRCAVLRCTLRDVMTGCQA